MSHEHLHVGALNHEQTGKAWILTSVAHYFGNEGVKKVSDAIDKARAAGVPWLSILATLLPLILSIFSGGKLDIASIIAAILALIQPAPAPVTP